MNILVIGSEGFIGGFLMSALLDHGHQVIGYDIASAGGARCGYFLMRNADLMDVDRLTDGCRGVDMVINLAAKHHDFGISRREFFEINEAGTQTILDVLSAVNIRRFVYYSSVAVYGDAQSCSSEETPLAPSTDYGESKLAGEYAVDHWVRGDLNRAALIIRPSVVFGPHNYANMYRLLDNIYRRRFVRVGRGDNLKTVSYVENLVSATVFLLPRLKPGVQVFNYSDYPHFTSSQLVDMIKQALQRPRSRFHLPLRPVALSAELIDVVGRSLGLDFPITAKRIRKLNVTTWHGSDKLRALGFEQTVPIEEGILRMVRWYLATNGAGVSTSSRYQHAGRNA